MKISVADGAVGYDDYQIYLLLSCAPVQGHVAGLVDVSLHSADFDVA